MRTAFLREQTITNKNKVARTMMPDNWSTAHLDCGLCERKALGLKMILEKMPLYIGEKELIVGTRTLYGAVEKDKDKCTISDYNIYTYPEYINKEDIAYFGYNGAYENKGHFTPDFSIILNKGISKIIEEAVNMLGSKDLHERQIDFLKGVIAAYEGLSILINRYSQYAMTLSEQVSSPERRKELLKIANVCRNIAEDKASNFYEAIQLFWFAHLTTMIESFRWVNFGRLDTMLYPFLGAMPYEEAQQLIECLMLKMFDQTDINGTYLNKEESQLNITIGGVGAHGEDAVNPVTYMVLDGLEQTRLAEPLLAIRIHSNNPPALLERASELSIQGLNVIAYYNDDLFIDSMTRAGILAKLARQYAFDLCQDVTIPGKSDFFYSGSISLIGLLMAYLKDVEDSISFEGFMRGYKEHIAQQIKEKIHLFNETHKAMLAFGEGNHTYYFQKLKQGDIVTHLSHSSLMHPLPFISALYEGLVENAWDLIYRNLSIKDVGFFIGGSVEAINALAAIKKFVFDKKAYKLSYIYQACEADYNTIDFEVLRQQLWHAPKWGNDDNEVDLIGKEILEYACHEVLTYRTVTGGRHLSGIHQPHPVTEGHHLMATPEGRKNKQPVAVTLTPESGTIRNGPLAALQSAAKIDYTYCQWNFCMMLNYYGSTFEGNDGATLFTNMIKTYFQLGGLQHQPNILCLEELKQAQLQPEAYKDLIVRLWGVSAHFVDLTKELQDEIMSRLM